MPKPKAKQKQKPKAKPQAETPEETADKTTLNFLALMGILGLVLIVAGIGAIFLVSMLVGVGLIIAGIAVYVLFYIMEKRLKLI